MMGEPRHFDRCRVLMLILLLIQLLVAAAAAAPAAPGGGEHVHVVFANHLVSALHCKMGG